MISFASDGLEIEKDSQIKAEYKACVTREQKAAYRKKWSSMKFDKLTRKRCQSKSYQTVNKDKGVYLPAIVIAQREGGGKQGELHAARYVSKCQEMSGDWCSWNVMTERWDQRGYNKTMRTKD